MKKQIELTLEQAQALYKKNSVMDTLLLANFTKEELEKKQLPKSWHGLVRIEGYYINNSGVIMKTTIVGSTQNDYNKIIYATLSQARSALAKAQLSQLMKAYNGECKADWTNVYTNKYTISRMKNELKFGMSQWVYEFLAFPTEELRDEFLKNFQELINEYFEL